MTPIRSSLRQMLVCLCLMYVAALMLSADRCTRMHRAAVPVYAGDAAIDWVRGEDWVPAPYQETLDQWRGLAYGELQQLLQQRWMRALITCAS